MTTPADTNGRKVTSLREMPQSIEPARDLWPGIEAQLGELPEGAASGGTVPARRRGQPLRWLAAAAMLASVALGVWIGRSLLPGTAGIGTPQVSANRTAVPPLAPTALDAAYVSDPRYAQQRAALVQALQARPAGATPPAAPAAPVPGRRVAVHSADR